MGTSEGLKKSWETRKQKYGNSGHSEDGLAKRREGQRNPQYRQKLSLALTGKPKSSEHLKKTWETRREKYGHSGVSLEGLTKLQETAKKTHLGKPLSPEHREKIAQANRETPKPWLEGRSVSEETRLKISSSQKGKACPQRGRVGRVVSDEWRRKISEAKKGVVTDRTNHDARIMSEMERLKAEGYKVIPTGLWKFPVPDLVAVRDGSIKAIEIELGHGSGPTKLNHKIEAYQEHFDKVEIIKD